MRGTNLSIGSPLYEIQNKTVIKLLLISVCVSISLGAYLFSIEKSGQFIWATFEATEGLSSSSSLSELGNNPGYVTLLHILTTVLAIEPPDLAIMPIGLLIGPIIYYVVTRNIFEYQIIGFIALAYVISDITQTGWHNVFAYAWARPLYLVGLALLVHILFTTKFDEDRRFAALFIIIFNSIVWIHYTPGVWLISLTGVVVFFGYIDDRSWTSKVAILLAFMMVVYFSSTQIIYNEFIPSLLARFKFEASADPMAIFLSEISSMLFGGESTSSGPHRHTSTRDVYSRIRLLINIFFAGMILLSVPTVLKKLVVKTLDWSNTVDIETYIYSGLVATVLIHAIMYGIVFSISTQPLIFLGPILFFLALSQLNPSKRTVYLSAIIIVGLAIISLVVRLSFMDERLLRYSLIEPGAVWFDTYHSGGSGNQQSRLLASSHLYHYYNYAGTGGHFTPVYFTGETYQSLVAGEISGTADYLTVDPTSRERFVQGIRMNVRFEPLGQHQTALENSDTLNKVYTNEDSQIYKIENDGN